MTASANAARRISPLTTMFLYSALAALRPLLRPSARNDLRNFVDLRIETEADASRLALWTQHVIAARRVDLKEMRQGRAQRAVSSDPLRIFRRPERAFRPRLRI